MNPRSPSIVGLRILSAALQVGAFGTVALGASAQHALAQDVPALAAVPAITGVIRDTAGAPQIGAVVELLGANLTVIARTFTDDRGRYALPRVSAGTYEVEASGSFFLPTLRENLHLVANSRLVVNLTLNTLYEALRWLPAQPRQPDEPKDDWNWTLRLATNRPLLRVLADGNGASPVVIVSNEGEEAAAARRVTIRSGNNYMGDGGLHQDVEVERSHDDAQQLILRTDLGDPGFGQFPAQSEDATVQSTLAYLRQLTPGRAVISVASFSDRPNIVGGLGRGLEVLTLRSATTMNLGPGLEAEAGSELEAARLGSTIAANHPFASVTVQDGAVTASYHVATSPGAEQSTQLDRDASLSPLVSEQAGSLRFEQGTHQAFALERHTGSWSAGVTLFHDALQHPVVNGGVAVLDGRPALASSDAEGGNVLYDPGTELIAVSGPNYTGSGIVAFARDQLSPVTWLSLRYAVGRALAMTGLTGPAENRSLAEMIDSIEPETSPMLSAAVGSTSHHMGTQWRASYRWQPYATLTQVDPFDSDTPEAYLSLHLRQPIHARYMGSHGMQAIVDVHNLLAQGYRPFLSQDGSMLYFAQAERCVEAGLSFSF